MENKKKGSVNFVCFKKNIHMLELHVPKNTVLARQHMNSESEICEE